MRVVIVGGGTAGWMAAAALSKYLGASVSITLIESEAIGTVGVGEATIPQIRLFNSGLGIDEREFLRETNGTFKLGIEFIDWERIGTRYFHGFGDVGRKAGIVPFHHYWLRYRRDGGTLDIAAFSANALAAQQCRYGARSGQNGVRLPVAAYHFDAMLYAGFLRRFAEARGVVRHEGQVVDWSLDPEDGFVRSLACADGSRIAGDLFLDCSGFRGLLIEQALQSGFEDWSHWLPCNRALAIPSAGNGDLDPFTRATARHAGWQWQIPLQHRTGNGYVYAADFIEEAAALQDLQMRLPGEALGDARPLRFTTGKRRQIWKKNVVAVGLSSGFLEPLESTSIHLIQSTIARLLSFFPDPACDPALIDAFNGQMDFEFAAIRDFLILHYHASSRDDSEFWRYVRHMPLPDSLVEKLDLYRRTGRIVRHNSELFDVPSWLQVMWGQGLRPQAYHPMVDAAKPEDVKRFIDDSARDVQDQVAALADHAAYLRHLTTPVAGPSAQVGRA